MMMICCVLFIAHHVFETPHSTRLPAGSEAQKEWLMYKENMKATVEQYKVINFTTCSYFCNSIVNIIIPPIIELCAQLL